MRGKQLNKLKFEKIEMKMNISRTNNCSRSICSGRGEAVGWSAGSGWSLTWQPTMDLGVRDRLLEGRCGECCGDSGEARDWYVDGQRDRSVKGRRDWGRECEDEKRSGWLIQKKREIRVCTPESRCHKIK